MYSHRSVTKRQVTADGLCCNRTVINRQIQARRFSLRLAGASMLVLALGLACGAAPALAQTASPTVQEQIDNLQRQLDALKAQQQLTAPTAGSVQAPAAGSAPTSTAGSVTAPAASSVAQAPTPRGTIQV